MLNIGWKVPASNSVADMDLARLDDGRWFRWFADPVYGRGYPADMVDIIQNWAHSRMAWTLCRQAI